MQSPREWYYALMDYGVMLKKTFPNPNRKSKHYTKQSKFEGSNRQIRGAIIKKLIVKSCRIEILAYELEKELKANQETIQLIIDQLHHEHIIMREHGVVFIK